LQNANNEEYFFVEPNISSHNIFKLTPYKEAIEKADLIVYLVGHREFRENTPKQGKVILDFCGITGEG
jgi:UDP-N-acetyl-D-mannosaminuronic acid dehydrogenase